MSQNAKSLSSVAQLRDRSEIMADARFARVSAKPGAFAQKWRERNNTARGLVFNPYAARAGEIRACTRLTIALLKEGESYAETRVRTVRRVGKEKEWGWNTPEYIRGSVFIGPWLTRTWVGGTWGPLRPAWVARESSPEDVEDVAFEKAVIGWLNSAADLAAEMKAGEDRLGLTCLRKFFEAGVTGSGTGPNSPYCSHVQMDEVVGRMSPARLVRRMVEVRFAALRRMRPLAGVIKTPSWAAVAVAAVQSLPVGKASIVAMAMTIAMPRLGDGGGNLRHYRHARAWLTANLASAADKVEEVEGVTTVTRPAATIHGVCVSRTVELCRDKRGHLGAGGRTAGFLGRIGEFQFHGSAWMVERKFAKMVLAEYRKNRDALATATREAAFNVAIGEAVASGKVVILATWQDSYDAGNCIPGTAEFARRLGVTNRQWIDAAMLLGSGNTRAEAAGRVALRRASESFNRMRVSV